MSDEAHVLVVDDDDRIRDLLKRYLVTQGYRVTTASDASAARKFMSMIDFDIAILDIMMPGEDGLSLLSSIREKGDETPIMLLTARGLAEDRIEGLKLGADDYLPKPFEPEELSLRAAAILRRTLKEAPPEEIEMSGLIFNSARGELKHGDIRVRLTEAELQLLSILTSRAGEAVTREELAAMTSAGLERSIDVQVTGYPLGSNAPVDLNRIGQGYRRGCVDEKIVDRFTTTGVHFAKQQAGTIRVVTWVCQSERDVHVGCVCRQCGARPIDRTVGCKERQVILKCDESQDGQIARAKIYVCDASDVSQLQVTSDANVVASKIDTGAAVIDRNRFGCDIDRISAG